MCFIAYLQCPLTTANRITRAGLKILCSRQLMQCLCPLVLWMSVAYRWCTWTYLRMRFMFMCAISSIWKFQVKKNHMAIWEYGRFTKIVSSCVHDTVHHLPRLHSCTFRSFTLAPVYASIAVLMFFNLLRPEFLGSFKISITYGVRGSGYSVASY